MRRFFPALLGLSVCAAPVFSASPELREVIITANRMAEPQEAALASTTVITRVQIQERQARSIEDVLAGVEGLAISNSGGPGKLTTFFVRGADGDQLLVLVDGARVGSATAGTAALQNIPVELVDRIEFVRGPRSSLYGADAIGGVLQVFTRQGGGSWRPEFAITGGSFDTQQLQAHVAGGSERAWLQLEGTSQKTDGINACRASFTAGCYTDEPDRDGYRNRSMSLRAGGELGSGTRLEANLMRAASRVDYDGFFANNSHILQQVLGASVTQTLGSHGNLALRVGRAWDRSDDYVDDDYQSRFQTRRDSAGLQWDTSFIAGQWLTVGADFLRDRVDGTTEYTVAARDNTGLYLQYMADIGRWRAEASLRGDDNEQFGRHATGTVAVGFTVNTALQLLAQYGTGFKAPSFNDLYYPPDPFFGPSSNPDLDPERSRSIELAARGRAGAASWRLSAFQTRIRDLIGFDINFLPANIDAARIRGLEASVLLPWREWTFDTGLTLLNAENRSDGANRGRQLPRRPRQAGHVDVAYRLGAMSLGARLVAQSQRYDNAAGTLRMGGYGTLDLRAEARIAQQFSLQVRAANVLDKQYETIAYYNQPGRAIYVTLRYAGGE
jgi:vitamin B12 transporter